MDEKKDVGPGVDFQTNTKVDPPPGLGFPSNATEVKLKSDTSGAQVKTKYQMRRAESHIPDNMSLYEQDWKVQTFIVGVTILVAVLNVSYNFEMIKVYEGQANQLRLAINSATPIDSAAMEVEYLNRTEEGEYLCDIEYFNSAEFSGAGLLETTELLVRIAKASTYLAVGLFVPMHLGFKALSAFYMVTNEYHDEEARKKALAAAQEANAANPLAKDRVNSRANSAGAPPPIVPTQQVLTRAGQQSMILENEDEMSVRVFLRAETVLFAWVQGFQDIPQASLAILFIIFQRAIRGVLCYEGYLAGEVNPPAAYETINSTAYIQLGLVALSTLWNFMILGARWIQYFHFRTIKHQKKPRSLCFRLIVSALWLVIYTLGVATPIFALVWTQVGTSVIGFPESSVGTFFFLTVIGGVCAGFGFLLVCCYWGTNFAEGVCVTCVIWEACCVAGTACEVEWCEFCDLCCPC